MERQFEPDRAAQGGEPADPGEPGGAVVGLADDLEVVGADVDQDRAVGAGQVQGQGGLVLDGVHPEHRLDGQDVDRAEELGHEGRPGVLVEQLGRAHLLDLALVQDDDLVGHLERLLLVVGDEQAGDVDLVVELAEPGPQLVADPGIERPEGLVQQEDLGPGGQRPGQGHPLPLPARELRGVPPGIPRKLDEVEQLVDPPADLGLGELLDLQAEGDVLADRHVPEQGVVLEDEPHPPPLDRQVRGVQPRQLDLARVRRLQPRDDPQDRALARPRRPEQRHELPLGHLERDVVDGLEVAEPLGQVANRDPHVEPLIVARWHG